MNTISLYQARPSQPLRVVAIEGGHQLIRRLMGLGIRVGVSLTISHHRGHAVVVAVQGSRVALGRGMASKLLVVEEATS